jgi:hypothetical protein
MKKTFVCFAVAVLSTAIAACNSGNTSGTANMVATENNHSNMAYVATQNYIKKKLSNATSIDFPFRPEEKKYDTEKQTYLVRSSVTVEMNGVASNRSFNAILKFKGGEEADDNNWEVLALDFQPQSTLGN